MSGKLFCWVIWWVKNGFVDVVEIEFVLSWDIGVFSFIFFFCFLFIKFLSFLRECIFFFDFFEVGLFFMVNGLDWVSMLLVGWWLIELKFFDCISDGNILFEYEEYSFVGFNVVVLFLLF